MNTKMTDNKTEKEIPTPTSNSGKETPNSEAARPLTKRRSRRRLPSW